MIAEYLHDDINMIDESGDVVPRDDLTEANEHAYDTGEPFETGYSATFFTVENVIRQGIEKSIAGGYSTVKVEVGGRRKPIGQYLAIDIYKYGLSADEVRELLDRYNGIDTGHTTTRSLGRSAIAGSDEVRAFDVRELASGLHKETED